MRRLRSGSKEETEKAKGEGGIGSEMDEGGEARGGSGLNERGSERGTRGRLAEGRV